MQMQGDRVAPTSDEATDDLGYASEQTRVAMLPSNFPEKVHVHV